MNSQACPAELPAQRDVRCQLLLHTTSMAAALRQLVQLAADSNMQCKVEDLLAFHGRYVEASGRTLKLLIAGCSEELTECVQQEVLPAMADTHKALLALLVQQQEQTKSGPSAERLDAAILLMKVLEGAPAAAWRGLAAAGHH